jgi:hypothetical protein
LASGLCVQKFHSWRLIFGREQTSRRSGIVSEKAGFEQLGKPSRECVHYSRIDFTEWPYQNQTLTKFHGWNLSVLKTRPFRLLSFATI